MQDKATIQLKVLNQLKDMIRNDIEKVGTVMDDYDGGQVAAYEKCLMNIRAYEAIINHTSDLNIDPATPR